VLQGKEKKTTHPEVGRLQKRSPNVVFVDDTDKCVIRNTKSLGIMWRKCQLKGKILVERADIVTWRSRYLKDIHEYQDNGHLMFYVHNAWMDINLTFCKCWQEGEVKGSRERGS